MQQELQVLKEQFARHEVMRDNLDREVKTIPALTESNEILKNDLSNLRKRYKEEKGKLTNQIKHLESQTKDTENIKSEVRTLAMRLMEVSSGSAYLPPSNSSNTNNNISYASSSSNQKYDPVSSTFSHQTINSAYQPKSQIHQPNLAHTLEDDDEDDQFENDSEYDPNVNYMDDNSQVSVESMESLQIQTQMNHHGNSMLMMNQSAPSQQQQVARSQNQQNSGKKKKVKKAVVTSTRAVSNSQQQQQSQQQMNMMQSNLATSFSLPRI
jgi:hypothetical protein